MVKRFHKKIDHFRQCSNSTYQNLVGLVQDLQVLIKADKVERQSERAADKAEFQVLMKADKVERQSERAADKAEFQALMKADKVERQLERAADKVELKQLLNGYKPLWTKAAAHYELSVRTYIKNRRQINDVEAYKCQNVQQLADICLPAGYEFKQHNATKIFGIRTTTQMGVRATNLAKIALRHISTLRRWMESTTIAGSDVRNDNLTRKLSILEKHLHAYDALHSNPYSPTSEEAKLQYLRDDRLGFFAFTSVILADQPSEGFIEELEIDYRLLPTVVLQGISLFVGEIKSGSGGGTYELALRQVLRRLGVLYMAGLYSLGDHASNYSFVGVGEIVSPNVLWNDPDANTIEKIKKTAGIVMYPPALHITVELIA